MFLNFSSLCTKVSMSYWGLDRLGVLDTLRRRTENKLRGWCIRPFGGWELKKEKQSQSMWLAFIVIWCEECGRKKIRKGERNKRERLFGHLKKSKKREVPQVRLRTKVQSGRTAWVRASQREEKNREGKRKYTARKRAVSEKKKRDFFYSSCIFKCCNLYLI